jgi:hypothetical protein
MILLHDENVELSRALLATRPDGVTVIDCTAGASPLYPYVSAYPTVVVRIPETTALEQSIGEDTEYLGRVEVVVPAHDELLRMVASWDAVKEHGRSYKNAEVFKAESLRVNTETAREHVATLPDGPVKEALEEVISTVGG